MSSNLSIDLKYLAHESLNERPDLLPLIFEYIDGFFHWKIPPRRCNRLIGDRAGWTCNQGYRHVAFGGRSYMEHRLIYSMFNGPIDKSLEVDHINGKRDDNRIENLRAVSKRKNQQNRMVHRNGHVVGTHFDKVKKLWAAHVQVNKRRKFLGYFETQQEAGVVYKKYCEENSL